MLSRRYKKSQYKTTAAVVLFFALFLPAIVSGNTTNAVIVGSDNPVCIFDTLVEQINNFQGAEDLNDNKIILETELRKKALINVVGCALLEVNDLRHTLKNVDPTNPSVYNIKNRFLSQLNDVGNFYSDSMSGLESMTLEETKVLASDILSWRTNYYISLRKRFEAFALWAENQELIRGAENRLQRFEKAITALDIKNSGRINFILSRAKLDFDEALRTNSMSKRIFSDVTTLNNPIGFMKTSLRKLALTYQNFIELSKEINKILTRQSKLNAAKKLIPSAEAEN